MNKQQKSNIELDIALTKQAFDKPVGKPWGNFEALLESAIVRENDKRLVFVPINGLTPIEAVNRIKNVCAGNTNKCKDPIPVDLSNVFEGTEPATTIHIEKLHSVMSLTKACKTEDIPEEIIFAIPRSDIVDEDPLNPPNLWEKDFSDFDQVRYVNYNSMPKELQKVVRMYQTLKTTSKPDKDFILFVSACRMLLTSAAGWNH